MRVSHVAAALMVLFVLLPSGAKAQGENTTPPLFTSTPTVLLRSPDPAKLAEFYLALGMTEARRNQFGVIIYLEGGQGSLEILQMDAETKPGGPKTTRTQQGVVAIFEVTDQVELVRRAREAGATLVERWTSSERGHSIYYVGDWENNVFGFAPRYHNPKIKVP
ncbi:MAG: hypothetical protein GKS03_13035 [Alphaproteobacteria bacterium]|nr:hypothetical protein [Alphaproteobacteria bacterium]